MESYHVRIEQFEGPLDLLLHLIEQAKVDIEDIFVSQITAQYLAYLSEMQALDMNVASEFLTMAATLVYIKSRQLLPRIPVEEETEEIDPEKALIQQLQAYRQFREISKKLETFEQNSLNSFSRLREELALEQVVQLQEVAPEALLQAFCTAFFKENESIITVSHEVHQDSFTIRSQLIHIRTLLACHDSLSFENLFEKNASKMEKIVTFMALLEMINREEIRLKQPHPFAPILIQPLHLRSEDESENYMDEIEV